MKDEQDLKLLINSRFPIIAIETHEEARALVLLKRCVRELRLALSTWSVASGLVPGSGGAPVSGTTDPAVALREVSRASLPGVYVWMDFHPFLANPIHVRLMKEVAADYDQMPRTQVLIGHQVAIPPEIEKLTVRFELSLPGRDAIMGIVKAEVAEWQRRQGKELKGERDVFDLMLRHLSGLPEVDIRRLVRHTFQDDGLINGEDLPRIIRQKHAILARDSVLSFEIDTTRFGDVAGLKALKAWLDRRRGAFLDEAAGGQRLDVPKGIMLLGVQGCGKSLAAKAVAGTWGVPLMRLDFGALYNKFLGETERNLREALKSADAMAPCVLWIDEIEKGVATNDGTMDGGESRRILGTLLTWMAERDSRVFIVATSNDIQALPPELVRKGRLDEIFFVDLPDAESRAEIFRIHLKRRGQDPAAFDLAKLAEQAAGFSGAEIEQAVAAGMYEAASTQVPLGAEHLAAEIARTKPLSVVMGERIAYLRAWAADRTVKAD